jgi:inward rectifier potassium channel
VADPNAPKPVPQTLSPQVRLFASDAQRQRTLKVINASPPGLRDLYHVLLRASWPRVGAAAAVFYFVVNALFGLVFYLLGGVTGATSYADHFFFSVHTFGTIGYGSMYPQSNAAELVVSFESLLSLGVNALLTGLAFAKFARPTARLLWSNKAVISDREGVPTLMFRVANERRNHVVEANIRAAVVRAEVTKEGETLRRVVDLPLVRSSSPTFILTWTVMHQVTKDSPLYGMTPARLKEVQAELVLTLTGLDETLGQTIHARTSFLPEEVAFGARYGDIISTTDEGRVLDYALFHDTRPAPLNWEAMGVSAPASSEPK